MICFFPNFSHSTFMLVLYRIFIRFGLHIFSDRGLRVGTWKKCFNLFLLYIWGPKG